MPIMNEMPWQEMLKRSLKTPSDLNHFTLTENEKAFFAYEGDEDKLQFLVNPYYASLAENLPDDPIRKQIFPSIEEYTVKPVELTDPLGEKLYTPVPRLIHRYKDRVLLLVTDTCAAYCRHCFRRSFAGHKGGIVTDRQLKKIAEYLDQHREVNEILLSGGDPLTCSNEKLEQILKVIRSVRPEMVIRLATRIPVVLPMRIDDSLVEILTQAGPIWIVTQFNHPQEITEESEKALKKLIDKGIPLLNQAVLLKGINDEAQTLADLFQAMVRLRVKPYYLFQGDLAAGTSHFRVSIDRGREIMRQLRTMISGLALPQYAVDLPGGGGKIPLTEDYQYDSDKKNYYFYNMDGKTYSYPREDGHIE